MCFSSPKEKGIAQWLSDKIAATHSAFYQFLEQLDGPPVLQSSTSMDQDMDWKRTYVIHHMVPHAPAFDLIHDEVKPNRAHLRRRTPDAG